MTICNVYVYDSSMLLSCIQVTIYSMMLSEKEKSALATDKLNPGLLVYLKDGSMQQVAHSEHAIRGECITWRVMDKG